MDNKTEAWRNMNSKKYEFESKANELLQAKEEYREALVNDTINHIITIQKDDGKITERDLKLFLGDLAIKTMQLYSK